MDHAHAQSIPLKVGDLARQTGKSVRALRLYEELGLLQPLRRSEGGFRLYGADEVARVYWISKLQDLGFTLQQIKALVDSVEGAGNGPAAMQNVRELFRGRLQATRQQVERLLQLERDLAESLAYLEGCRACPVEHDVTACGTCASVHMDKQAPTLVAGIHLPQAPLPGLALVRGREGTHHE